MIRINKTLAIPAILSGDGVTQTNMLNDAYAASPHLYTSAVGVKNRSLKSMKFDSKIYGDSTVKNLLKSDQHQKCCFCESIFTKTSYGDVEHFRPKSAYKKVGTKGYVYPGYYWLAYDWANLLFSCEICNRTYKKNEFPLGNELTRKLFHNHINNLVDEDRLLIDPTVENPADFMTFKKEVPVPVGGSTKGAKTIGVLELDRMNESRLNHIKVLKALEILTRIDINNEEQLDLAVNALKTTKVELINLIINANEVLNNAAKDSAMFAYCVRCNFPELPTV
ncbi:HNH endonuclease family protein [Spirosoma areae]